MKQKLSLILLFALILLGTIWSQLAPASAVAGSGGLDILRYPGAE